MTMSILEIPIQPSTTSAAIKLVDGAEVWKQLFPIMLLAGLSREGLGESATWLETVPH